MAAKVEEDDDENNTELLPLVPNFDVILRDEEKEEDGFMDMHYYEDSLPPEFYNFQSIIHKAPNKILLGELQDIVRANFSRIRLARVHNVFPVEDPGSYLIRYLDAPLLKPKSIYSCLEPIKSDITRTHIDYKTTDDTLSKYDLDKAVQQRNQPLYKSYYGFTSKIPIWITNTTFVSIPEDKLRGTLRMYNTTSHSAHFNSRTITGFDLSRVTKAWFDECGSDDLLRYYPPKKSDWIAGIVKEGFKGLYYSKWFYPSAQFINLYHRILYRATDAFAQPSTFNDLDCRWMWLWKYADDTPKSFGVNYDMATRVAILESNVFLHSGPTAHDGLGMYYFYQMFCFGKIVHWIKQKFADKKTTLKHLQNAALYHWLLYHESDTTPLKF
jgi:hypothetical protein